MRPPSIIYTERRVESLQGKARLTGRRVAGPEDEQQCKTKERIQPGDGERVFKGGSIKGADPRVCGGS